MALWGAMSVATVFAAVVNPPGMNPPGVNPPGPNRPGVNPPGANPPGVKTLTPYPANVANEVKITVSGDYREIVSNGIPNHPTGEFPNAHNPNTIRPQDYDFRVPLHPQVAASITPYDLGRFGVAVNGVPIEAAGAEFWNGDFNSGWQYEVLNGSINLGTDMNNAHVQPNGAYHYHGLPTGLITKLGGGSTAPKMLLLGYAADGFPIYNQYGYTDPKNAKSTLKKMKPSYALKKGNRPSSPAGPGGKYDGAYTQDYEYVAGSGDLDESNGQFGVTPEYPQGIYHYYITETFPIVPRSFRGTPDAAFLPPARGQGGPPGRGGPPPGAAGRRGPPPGPPGTYPPPRGGFPPPR